jgi:hypothetical protein
MLPPVVVTSAASVPAIIAEPSEGFGKQTERHIAERTTYC